MLDRFVKTRKSLFFVFVKFEMLLINFKEVKKHAPLVIRITNEVFAVNKVKVFGAENFHKGLDLVGVISETHRKAVIESGLLFLSEALKSLKI